MEKGLRIDRIFPRTHAQRQKRGHTEPRNVAGEGSDAGQRANWLPAPKGKDFSLFIRAYWPKDAILAGEWTPPAVVAR